LSEYANEAAAIDAATEAFEAANSDAPQTPQTPSPETASEQGDAGASSEETSFTNINPDDLPDELKHIYKSMQADYTRKTQEAAPYRKLAEAGVDPQDAIQSVQFLYELNNNPDFQQAVYDRLAAQYQSQGASPQEAAAQAAADVSSAVQPEDDDLDLLPPSVREKLASVDKLNAWVEQQEEERELLQLEAELTRQEMAIRQANPNYSEEDFDAIRQLGFAYGGDLRAAGNAYATLQQRLVSNYVNQKSNVNTATSSTPATGHSETPEKFENLDDAHKAALALAEARMDFDY
jgi:hypothetical protein